MSQRLFETLDQMNQEDAEKGTKLVVISNEFVRASKVKKGAEVVMGATEECLMMIASEKYVPLLVLVKADEYHKRKK